MQLRVHEEHGARFTLTNKAKQHLLAEGTDYRYGARHLKRRIERFLVVPFANLLATGQMRTGDVVVVDFDDLNPGFFRDEAVASLALRRWRRRKR